MKDWIKNDDTLAQTVRDTVEDEVQKYNSLMICADLANRSKHRELKNIRRDATLRGNIKVEITESVVTGESSSTTSWEYVVTMNDGSTQRALDIARSAIQDWESILASHRLNVT